MPPAEPASENVGLSDAQVGFNAHRLGQKVTDDLLESAEVGGRGVPLEVLRRSPVLIEKKAARLVGVDVQILLRAAVRIIRHCLEKDAADRFQSAKDLAFELEALAGNSGIALSTVKPSIKPRKVLPAAGAVALVAVGALGWALLRPAPSGPSFRRLTFHRSIVQAARFAPDGHTVMYAASWSGNAIEIFSVEPGSPESRPLGPAGTGLLSLSGNGQLAICVRCRFQAFTINGTLAEMPMNGGAPRELQENVAFADWTPDGKQLAVTTAGTPHRLEFPPGNVLYTSKGTGWLGEVRISPKGDRIAFVDHIYYGGDATVSVVDLKGTKTELTGKFGTVFGLAWTPDGKEVWFAAAKDTGQLSLYAVSLDRKQRLIFKLPGALNIHDISRDGKVLLTREESRMTVEFMGPGDEISRDLSWMDWSSIDDLSADGKVLAIDESGDATEGVEGGSLVYVRKTDGSPAVRMAAKSARVLSRWQVSALGGGRTERRRIALRAPAHRSGRAVANRDRAAVAGQSSGLVPGQ
jgi:Tol biopolymer transport system component